jgi:hypothetical protein
VTRHGSPLPGPATGTPECGLREVGSGSTSLCKFDRKADDDTSIPVVARLVGVPWFFAVLYVADRALARWGSATIRSRPRPGLRVAIVFASVVATYAVIGGLARWTASWSEVLAWAVLTLAVPACAASAVGVDHLLPDPRRD